MGETKNTAVKKLFGILHGIAVKGWPFPDVKDHIQLKKINGVKFHSGSYENDVKDHIQLKKINRVTFQSGLYENESSCRYFIKAISEFFFQKDIYKKLLRINFIAILCDGTTDTSITEQEAVYIF